MNRRYLAYIALLAGWVVFCYWLYTSQIQPRMAAIWQKSHDADAENIPYPLAFTWASADTRQGQGFAELKESFKDLDAREEWVMVTGYYFRDEATSPDGLQELGKERIENSLKYLDIKKDRLVMQVLPQEINADVRSNPFEAIRFDRMAFSKIYRESADTVELCFPLKDSLLLPDWCYSQLNSWTRKHPERKGGHLWIVGTADGSGVAESNDIAYERAFTLKTRLMLEGWEEERLHVSTGQRNNQDELRNRCVVIYFAYDEK